LLYFPKNRNLNNPSSTDNETTARFIYLTRPKGETALRSLPIALILLLIQTYSAFSGWLPGVNSIPQEFDRSAGIQVTQLANLDCLIEFDLPGLQTEFTTDGEIVRLPGAPACLPIPAITGFILTSEGNSPLIEILDLQYQVYDLPDYAAPEVSLANDNNRLAQFASGEIFCGNSFILRGNAIAPLTFLPFRYEASQGKIYLTSRLKIHLSFPGSAAMPALPPAFRQLRQNICWNYTDDPIDEFVPSSMLIICPDEFAAEIAPLVLWKNQKGVQTKLTLFSEIGASSTSEQIIKDYLLQQYNSLNPPEYVLFIGDETRFPIHITFTPDPYTIFNYASYPGWFANDNYFACLDGIDYVPDVFLGRISVANTTNLMKIVNKLISYEKNPNINDTSWYRKGMVCADDSEPTQRTTKLQVRDWMLSPGAFTQVDTVFGQGHTSQFMNAANAGRSFINYRGTGWDMGWSGIGVYIELIAAINNPNRFPIVTGIGCGVAKFDEPSPCFGETWMNAGTVTNPLGSAAFIGPTWNTHTYFNNCLDEGLYNALLFDSLRTLAPAFVQGKLSVLQEYNPYFTAYPNVEEIVRTLFNQYTLLSDPEILTRASSPKPLQVVHTDSIFLGASTVQVAVTDTLGNPLPGLQAALYSSTEDEVYVDETSAAGTVTFQPNLQMMPNSLYLTITGIDIDTYFDSIAVQSNGAYIAHYQYQLTENPPGDGLLAPGETIILAESVKNYGAVPAYLVSGVLSTTFPGVIFENDSSYFGNLAPFDVSFGADDYRFTVPPVIDQNTLEFNLDITAFEGNWNSSIILDVHQPEISLYQYQFDPGSDMEYERGGTVELEITLKNLGNLPAANLIGILTSLDPYEAIVTNGICQFDSLGINQTKNNYSQPFTFVVSGICPYDFTAHFDLEISGDQGTFSTEFHFPLEVEIGDPSSPDPSFDAQGRYFAYESRDPYEQAPDFNWVEISPALGGPGTIISFNPNTELQVLYLPFTFTYYGEDFSRITVSADGYLVPDSLGENATPVWSFLYDDGAPGAVAACWKDFNPSAASGDVSYYYNSVDGSFRIEYRNWELTQTPTTHAAFQIVIYHPDFRPTLTGDCEIEYYFSDIAAYTQFTSHCGIEDPEENDGIAIYQMYALYPAASWPPQPNTAVRFTTEEPDYVDVEPTEASAEVLPTAFQLYPTFPNPFNPVTTIQFALPIDADVSLIVYNILGRQVTVLTDDHLSAGYHQAVWDASDQASSIYFIRLDAPGYTQTVKCLLLK